MNPEIQWCEDFLFNLEYILHAERFYALQTPVYYYVKTKGSLVARNTSIANSVRMKRMVFAYYNNFYKHVLDPEDYEKNRLQIYRFLVNAAKDGLVLPAALPGNWKLGEERSSFCLAAAEREGFLAEEYRSRKLLDRCLESVALKNKLTLAEARQLLCLSYLREAKSRKEMADFAGVTPRSLNLSLQKLSARGLIRVEGGRGVRWYSCHRRSRCWPSWQKPRTITTDAVCGPHPGGADPVCSPLGKNQREYPGSTSEKYKKSVNIIFCY